jgi:hypothetical protein
MWYMQYTLCFQMSPEEMFYKGYRGSWKIYIIMHYLIERVQDFRKRMPQLHRGYFFHPSSLDFVKHRLDAYFFIFTGSWLNYVKFIDWKKQQLLLERAKLTSGNACLVQGSCTIILHGWNPQELQEIDALILWGNHAFLSWNSALIPKETMLLNTRRVETNNIVHKAVQWKV